MGIISMSYIVEIIIGIVQNGLYCKDYYGQVTGDAGASHVLL